MRKILKTIVLALCLATLGVGSGSLASAQPPTPNEGTSPKKSQRKLPDKQQEIATKYADLEELFLKLAKLSASSDPARAALLKEAYAQSRQKDLAAQLDDLARQLADDEALLSEVVKGQKSAHLDLKTILDLLQSEDRAKKIESENRRIRGYLKRLNRIIREQQGIHGRNEGGDDIQRLADRQNEIADKTKQLDGDIKQDNEENQAEQQPGTPQDGKPQDGKSQDGKPQDGKPQDGKPQDGKPQDGKSQDGKPQDGKPQDGKSQDGKPQDGKPQDGKPQDGKPGAEQQVEAQRAESQRAAEKNPVRKRLQRAEERMRKAQKNLDEAHRKEALEDQLAALDELNKAKAELEEILRQLREEEVERVLAMLEGRFRRMLDLQLEVNRQTIRLAKIPQAEREATQAGKASRQQRDVMLMCSRALNLLREEGSSVALPEATVQVRDDMREVVLLLSQYNVGALTIGIEQDIVSALEEIIDSLEQAQQDAKDRKNGNRPPPGSGGEPGDPPLVDGLAEIKMIRALQMRVNRRTKRYAALTDGPQAQSADMIRRLSELSERQKRIVAVTRDIVTEKNR